MPFDPNQYGPVAGLNIDWAAQQGQGNFLKLEDKLATPICILRALSDGKFCTDQFLIHHWNDPATGKYSRIPCGRSAGVPCLLHDKLDEMARDRKLDTVAEKVQRFMRGQDRHTCRVLPMGPYIAKARAVQQAMMSGNQQLAAQLRNALYDEMEKAVPIGWDFPKKVFETIWALIQSSQTRYQGRLVDPTDPRASCVVWVTRMPTAAGYKEYKVDIEFDLRVPIPLKLVQVMPTYDQLYQEEVGRISQWPPEAIGKLLGFQGLGTPPPALPPGAGSTVIPGQYTAAQPQYQQMGPPPGYQAAPGAIPDFAVQQPPPQAPYQPPAAPASAYAPPQGPPAGWGPPPTAPQGPGYPGAPEAQQYPGPTYPQPGATTSAAQLACLGHFNAGDPKCAHCGQMQPCLQAVRANAGQATAPAYAPPMAPPQATPQQPPQVQAAQVQAAQEQPAAPGQLAPAAARAKAVADEARAKAQAAAQAAAAGQPPTTPQA